jgi:hypothetical protein
MLKYQKSKEHQEQTIFDACLLTGKFLDGAPFPITPSRIQAGAERVIQTLEDWYKEQEGNDATIPK